MDPFDILRPNLKVKRLHPDAILPSTAHPLDSGLDLSTIEGAVLYKGTRRKFKTGLSIQLPPSYEGQIRPRSGLFANHGVTCHFGTIDQSYSGEICVILLNTGDEHFEVKPGMRVAQLVLSWITPVVVTEVLDIANNERGVRGFGSSGL